MTDFDPVYNGISLFGPRYDKIIDSKLVNLALKECDLADRLGNDHPEYKKFLEHEYFPKLQEVNDYLKGKTSKHPFKS